jgi:hypothetical protein
MRKIFIVFMVTILFASLVVAHGEEEFAQAEEIIKQRIPCEELTESQLEILGDYYMEQMHPGESHEIMDERMGGEGSESLRVMHINMGKAFYCGNHGAMSGGMMDTMMGRGMMGGGMMGSFGNMMGYNSGYGIFGWIFWALVIVLLVLLIVWLVKQIQEKPRVGRK